MISANGWDPEFEVLQAGQRPRPPRKGTPEGFFLLRGGGGVSLGNVDAPISFAPGAVGPALHQLPSMTTWRAAMVLMESCPRAGQGAAASEAICR